MNHKVIIHPAKDKALIKKLIREYWIFILDTYGYEYTGVSVKPFVDSTIKSVYQIFRNEPLELDKNNYHILTVDGRIAGFISIDLTDEDSENEIFINDLYVRSEFQGMGNGKLLLSFAEQLGIKHNYSKVGLWCDTKNIKACDIYKKYDFKIVDQGFLSWRDSVGETVNKSSYVVMEKIL